MVFPLFKIGVLFTKHLMKPVSRSFRNYALRSPHFANGCHRVALSYQKTEGYLRRSLRLPYYERRKLISKDEAIRIGGEILGESIIFGFAGTLLIYEYAKPDRFKVKVTELEQRVTELEKKSGVD